jgi:pimeloyl-ACP methyl ester carboxylesterase
MQPQRVIIHNNRNEKLVGYLYKGTTKTLIIVCYGIEAPKESHFRDLLNPYFSEIVERSGASVYSFDFSGMGESKGKNFISLRQRDKEVKSVIDYFSSTYDRIILYGFSLGGLSAAIGTLHNKNIVGLITVNGFFTFNPKRLFRTNLVILLSYLISKPRFAHELYYRKKELKIKAISVPTLVVYSDNDTFVNPGQSVVFFNELQTKKKLVTIKSDDHMLEKEYIQIPPQIALWMKEEGLS